MASRSALAVRVADAKDEIAKSMGIISNALGVEIPAQPHSYRKNDPSFSNAVQLDHVKAFLKAVADALAPVESVPVPEAVVEEVAPAGEPETVQPVVLDPIPDPAPVVEESVVEPRHDKHSKHGKKGR